MKQTCKDYMKRILLAGYLIGSALIGFSIGHFLFRIPSLNDPKGDFYITNTITDLLVYCLCIAFSGIIVYFAYVAPSYFNNSLHSTSKVLYKTAPIPQTRMAFNTKQPLILIVFIIILLITAIKLNLIGTGFLSIPDEIRYCESGKALHYLSELKISYAAKNILSTQGRPADALLNIIPIGVQFITSKVFNLNCYESHNSYPLFVFNFIIYCLILIYHYKFSKLLLTTTYLALLSVLLFSTLTNSYLYIRHALPYDKSLLVYYLVLYNIVLCIENNNLSPIKSLIFGFCAFFGFLIYPGYYPLLFVGLFILFVYKISNKELLNKLIYSSYYILGIIICLYIFEKTARIVGRSYIFFSLGLSKTITQGSFDESFSYIANYLFDVEGLTGIILLISLPLYILTIISQFKSKPVKQYSLIMLTSIALAAMFLSYAGIGYFLHRVVFYGRLLHQYLPFICIFAIFAINETLKKLTRRNELILFIISIVFIINFGVNFLNYNSLAYPRDVYWQLVKINKLHYADNCFKCDNLWPIVPQMNDSINHGIHEKRINARNYIITEGTSFNASIYLINKSTNNYKFNSNDNYHLLKSIPSFINFKAYQYDSGASKIERYSMDKQRININIFAN
jgi:hypothetical protein